MGAKVAAGPKIPNFGSGFWKEKCMYFLTFLPVDMQAKGL